MKRILKYIALTQVVNFIYWCYLELDARTMAEMPPCKYKARLKADKYYPF